MKIVRGSVKELYSCNGCKRGKLKENGLGFEYPYDQVTVIEALHTSMRLCDDCLKEVIKAVTT